MGVPYSTKVFRSASAKRAGNRDGLEALKIKREGNGGQITSGKMAIFGRRTILFEQ